MKSTWRSRLFVIDQVISSAISFVFFTSIARLGGVETVGSLGVMQAVAMIALTSARAVSVDVWVTRGSERGETRQVLAVSQAVAIVPFAVCMVIILTMFGVTPTSLSYAIVVPFIVMLDSLRIIMMHEGKSTVSIGAQGAVLFALVLAATYGVGEVPTVIVYSAGIITCFVVCTISLGQKPSMPSLRFARNHSSRALPFLGEMALGSVLQQSSFILIGVLASLETAGLIRIAQTIVAPIQVVHTGLSSIYLRRFARSHAAGQTDLPRQGLKAGARLGLASLGILMMVLVTLQAPILPGKLTLLVWLVGAHQPSLGWVMAIAGLTLALNGVALGAGTAVRALGLTGQLNQIRLWVLPLQLACVAFAALHSEPVLAAGALAASAALTAGVSIVVVGRLRDGRS